MYLKLAPVTETLFVHWLTDDEFVPQLNWRSRMREPPSLEIFPLMTADVAVTELADNVETLGRLEAIACVVETTPHTNVKTENAIVRVVMGILDNCGESLRRRRRRDYGKTSLL